MGKYCIASGCTNNDKKHQSQFKFYRFPKDLAQRSAWIDKMGRGGDWDPGPSVRQALIFVHTH